MRVNTATGATEARANPFAFPSDTTTRFLLLLVFAAATDSAIWSSIGGTVLGAPSSFTTCTQGWVGLAPSIVDPVQAARAHACNQARIDQYLPGLVAAQVGGAALLALSTIALWWLHPRWLDWRMGLSPLVERDAPDLTAELRSLCRVAGLRRAPQFHWNPLGMDQWARAYGRAGRYWVGLTGAVAVTLTTDPLAFRAMILHELAHIANRDIDKTALASAIWRSLLLTGLLPLVCVAAWIRGGGLAAIAGLIQAIAIAALVALTFNAILRARELYADTRASSWLEDTSGLSRALAALRPQPGLRRLVSPHPDPGRRLGVLRSTDRMFQAGTWDLFAVGIASSLVGGFLFSFAIDLANLGLVGNNIDALAAFFGPALLLSPMITGVAVTMIWRTTFVALLRGAHPAGAGRGGVALGSGMVLGGILWGVGFPSIWLTEVPPWPAVAAMGLWGVLGFVPAIGVLKWAQLAATAWLPGALCRDRPGQGLWVAILSCCIFAVPWFALAGPVAIGTVVVYELYPWLQPWLRIMFPVDPPALLFALTANWLVDVIAVVATLVIWGFPLAAALWAPKRSGAISGWAFLDVIALPGSAHAIATPLQAGLAVAIGAIVGMLAGLVLPWAHLPLSADDLVRIGFPPQFATALQLIVSMALTAILVPGIVGVLVASVVKYLTLAHAMFAAFIAATVLSVAIGGYAGILDAGWRTGIVTFGFCYGPIMIWGGALALAGALLTRLLRAICERLRSAKQATPGVRSG